MKILYLHQHFSTPSGAIGTRSYEMAIRLLSAGHKVTMVCGSVSMAHTGLNGDPQDGILRGNVDGIHVIKIPLPYSNYISLLKRSIIFLKFALATIRIAFKEQYDVLFATSTPLTVAIPGIIIRILKPRKKFVFEVRDLWPELPKAMKVVKNPILLFGLWALEQFAYGAMHAGIALSPGIRKGMLKGMGAGKMVTMIPNGCDLELFRLDGLSTKNIKYTLPETSIEDRLFIFTGAHGVANGLDAVLDAAAILKERKRNDIKLLFIGDGKLKPKLQRRAFYEKLKNCIFLDPIPKKKLAVLLRNVDVGLMILDNVPAFYYGTSPNKFFDYIASGLPVLINYPGWLADLITEHHCGIVVPPKDPDAFADALIHLADNSELRKNMGENSCKLAEYQFSRQILADRFVSFLEFVGKAEKAAQPLI